MLANKNTLLPKIRQEKFSWTAVAKGLLCLSKSSGTSCCPHNTQPPAKGWGGCATLSQLNTHKAQLSTEQCNSSAPQSTDDTQIILCLILFPFPFLSFLFLTLPFFSFPPFLSSFPNLFPYYILFFFSNSICLVPGFCTDPSGTLLLSQVWTHENLKWGRSSIFIGNSCLIALVTKGKQVLNFLPLDFHITSLVLISSSFQYKEDHGTFFCRKL